MKLGRLLFVIFLVWFLSTALAFSQTPGVKSEPGMRTQREDVRCGRAMDLNLSHEQLKELDLIQQCHLRETQFLRAQLFAKRLELRESLTNPIVKTELIRSKHGEVASLELKIEEKYIDFLVKLRNFLTPVQLRNWCPEKEFLPPRGAMGHGPGMMGPGGRRRPPLRDFDRRDEE